MLEFSPLFFPLHDSMSDSSATPAGLYLQSRFRRWPGLTAFLAATMEQATVLCHFQCPNCLSPLPCILLHDHCGRQSDPFKSALVQALPLLKTSHGFLFLRRKGKSLKQLIQPSRIPPLCPLSLWCHLIYPLVHSGMYVLWKQECLSAFSLHFQCLE